MIGSDAERHGKWKKKLKINCVWLFFPIFSFSYEKLFFVEKCRAMANSKKKAKPKLIVPPIEIRLEMAKIN